jgi:hypothetical protein
MADDDGLLAELGEAVQAAQVVPPRFLQVGRDAFVWHTVDAELAELSYDSAAEPPAALAGVRADPSALRVLTFAASGVTIEVDVTAVGLQGQVVPAVRGEIELQLRDGSRHTTPLDDAGWFLFTPRPAEMFRLCLRSPERGTALTPWTVL